MLEKIKKLCQERGITLAEVERACGIGSRTMYRWGETSPAVDKVKAVADFFGVTVDELLR